MKGDSKNTFSKVHEITDYLLTKTIGEGTFGKVVLGTHKIIKENVAIKVLDKNKISEVADVERVSREMHILKTVRHPNIIHLYEVIETPYQLFLITEYANGGELFDYIVNKKRLGEPEATKFFQQIISGIEYLHKLNFAHRDLKPENLLLEDSNKIKIVDFGLSNTYKNDETLKTACGSPCYAAPEMISGRHYDGMKADIWSIGIILYAMLCGYLPFEDKNTSILYRKILSGQFDLPKYLSNESKDLLKRILQVNPKKRITINEIKKHSWFLKQNLEEEKEGIQIGINTIPIDFTVLEEMKKYDINPKIARNFLEANEHNKTTTIYYLLLKKFQHEGKKIISPYTLIQNPLKEKNKKKDLKDLKDLKDKNDQNLHPKFQQIDKRSKFINEFKYQLVSPSKKIEEGKIKKNSLESISQKPDIKRADCSMDFRSIDNLRFNDKSKQKLNKSSHYISSNGMLYQFSPQYRSSFNDTIAKTPISVGFRKKHSKFLLSKNRHNNKAKQNIIYNKSIVTKLSLEPGKSPQSMINFQELIRENSSKRLNFICIIDFSKRNSENNQSKELSSKVFNNILNIKEKCSKNNSSSNRLNKYNDTNYFLGAKFLTKSIDKHSFSKQFFGNETIKRSGKLNKSLVGLKTRLNRYSRMSKDNSALNESPKKIIKNKTIQQYMSNIPYLKYKKNKVNLSIENIMYKNPYEPIYVPSQTQKNDKLQIKFRMRKYKQLDDNIMDMTNY